MKVLSAETGLGSATNISKAPVVRVYNSDSSAVTLTRKASDGTVIGTYSIPSDKVIYCQKSYTDTLEGGAALKATAIGYTEMLDIITLASGAGGVITDNLAFHLDAGNSESYGDQTTLWKDLTSNNNDFSKKGSPTHDSSTNGGIFTLDGTDDAFFCAHNSSQAMSHDDNITFEIWVKIISAPDNFNYLMSKNRNVSNWTGTGVQSYQHINWSSQNKIGGYVVERINGTTYGSENAYDDDVLTTGAWKHIVLSVDFYNSNEMKLYINNTLEATGNVDDFRPGNGNLGNTGDFTIGAIKQASSWGSKYTNMATSIVRFYNGKALTSSEVAQHWNHEKARHGL